MEGRKMKIVLGEQMVMYGTIEKIDGSLVYVRDVYKQVADLPVSDQAELMEIEQKVGKIARNVQSRKNQSLTPEEFKILTELEQRKQEILSRAKVKFEKIAEWRILNLNQLPFVDFVELSNEEATAIGGLVVAGGEVLAKLNPNSE